MYTPLRRGTFSLRSAPRHRDWIARHLTDLVRVLCETHFENEEGIRRLEKTRGADRLMLRTTTALAPHTIWVQAVPQLDGGKVCAPQKVSCNARVLLIAVQSDRACACAPTRQPHEARLRIYYIHVEAPRRQRSQDRSRTAHRGAQGAGKQPVVGSWCSGQHARRVLDRHHHRGADGERLPAIPCSST